MVKKEPQRAQPQRPLPPDDPVKKLAEKLRGKGGIEWRSAVLQDQRVEVVRGKDFAAYFRTHEDLLQQFVSRTLPADQQITFVGELMLRRGLFVKAERMFKKPKPGKKRLVKWPKKLLPIRDRTFQEEFFYAWTYDRPMSPWTYLLSGVAVAVVMLCCLFPLAPYPVKLAAVYLSMTLLSLIMIILLVRAVIALATWVALGRSLWLFPYLLSEDKGIDEAFWPIFQLDEAPKEGRGSHWAVRIALGAALAGAVWAVQSYAPDKGAVKDGAWATHDAILEMLNLHEAGRQSLGHGGNETAGSAGGGGSGSSSGTSGRSSAGGGGSKAGSSATGAGWGGSGAQQKATGGGYRAEEEL